MLEKQRPRARAACVSGKAPCATSRMNVIAPSLRRPKHSNGFGWKVSTGQLWSRRYAFSFFWSWLQAVLYTWHEFRVRNRKKYGQIPRRFLVAGRELPVDDEQMRGVSYVVSRRPPQCLRCQPQARGASRFFCVICNFWEGLKCFDSSHGGGHVTQTPNPRSSGLGVGLGG
jgi:hypothetical protein